LHRNLRRIMRRALATKVPNDGGGGGGRGWWDNGIDNYLLIWN
jgi:hypothetical protein